MRTPYLALLPLVLFASYAAAQIAPVAPFALPAPTQPATSFDPQHPCALPTVCDTFGATSGQPDLPFTLKPEQHESLTAANLLLIPEMSAIPPTCYKLRAYEYTAGSPNSGQIQRTGTTTCQAATNFRMKGAVLSVLSSSPSKGK